MITFSGLMIGLLFFVGIFSGFTPYFSRKSSQFGVTLPEKYQNASLIKRQQKLFLLVNCGLTICLTLPIFYFMTLKDSQLAAQWLSFYLIFAMFVMGVVISVVFLRIRKKMLHFKAQLPPEELLSERQDIVIDTNYRHNRLTVPSWIILASNSVIIAVVIAVTLLNYDQIPKQIVTNWDINMQPDATVAKTKLTVLAIPMIQIFLMGVMYISNYSYQKAKQKLDPNKPEISVEKNRAFRYALSIYTLLLSIVVQFLIGAVQFIMIFDLMDKLNFPLLISLFIIVVLVGTVYLSIKYGQGGERLKSKNSGNSDFGTVAGYDDDASWKLGVIYFNPRDPSVWVEKRFGVGMTMNMASWKSWAFLIGVLLIPLVITFIFM